MESSEQAIVAADGDSVRTLRDVLLEQHQQPLPQTQALIIIREIGQALVQAHQQGMVYQQLRPENVLLSSNNHIRLAYTDWFSSQPGDGYTAPELYTVGAIPDALSDEYALGSIAYEMLTGRRVSPPLADIRSMNTTVSPQIAQAVMRTLAAQPELRYPSIEAFLSDISADQGTTPFFGFDQRTEPNAPTFPHQFESPVMPPPPPLSPPPKSSTLAQSGLRKVTSVFQQPLSPQRKRTLRIVGIVAALLVLALLVNFLLIPILPASAATVTITPVKMHLTGEYTVTGVTKTPDASQNQFLLHHISYTTPVQSQTVHATGQGGHDAVAAKGQVTISSITLSNGQFSSFVGQSTITANDGTQITVDSFVATQVGPVTTSAFATQAGSAGNIGAYDISGTYTIVNRTTQAQIGTAYIENQQGFTGGQDADRYTVVQQSDIDNVTNALSPQLTVKAQTQAQQQLASNEQLVAPLQCSPSTKANHAANDRADAVTITVVVTCAGDAYPQQEMQQLFLNAVQQDANTHFGSHYALVGQVQYGPVQTTTYEDGSIRFNQKGDSIWAFQFDSAWQQQIAQGIESKPQRDALVWLKQHGASEVNIVVSGLWGTALPSDWHNIHFVIKQVANRV